MMYLELSCVQGDKYGSICTLLQAAVRSDQHCFIEDATLGPVYIFFFLVKNQMSIGVWTCAWVITWIPLANISILMTTPYCFCYHNTT